MAQNKYKVYLDWILGKSVGVVEVKVGNTVDGTVSPAFLY